MPKLTGPSSGQNLPAIVAVLAVSITADAAAAGC